MNCENQISPPTAAANNAACTDAENTPPDRVVPTGPGELVHGLVHKLLQFDPVVNPVSLTRGTFAKFPASLPIPHEFDLSMVKKLRCAGNFVLVPGKRKGIDRYCLKRRESGTYLTPKGAARTVQVSINGKMEFFNVAKLLASSVLDRDVTGNEWGALIGTDGIWMENDADRDQLNEKMKIQCKNLPRVVLGTITRPGSETIDVAGKYYTQDGKVYGEKGNVIAMNRNELGHLKLTIDGCQKKVHLGRIMFTAYPDLYKFDPEYHDEIDHIDGDRTNNEPWNFRSVTAHQNSMVSVRTGDRSERPSPSSLFEVSNAIHADIIQKTTPVDDAHTFVETMEFKRYMEEEGFKRYLDTGYWVHESSCVLRLVRGKKYVENGYTYCGGHALHKMVMIAHGGFTKEQLKGLVIMHLNDDKQDNRLENLEVGTHSKNAHKTSPVEICIDGGDPQKFRGENEAARVTGINLSTIHVNRKRNRGPEVPQSTTTRGPSPITFTAV